MTLPNVLGTLCVCMLELQGVADAAKILRAYAGCNSSLKGGAEPSAHVHLHLSNEKGLHGYTPATLLSTCTIRTKDS